MTEAAKTRLVGTVKSWYRAMREGTIAREHHELAPVYVSYRDVKYRDGFGKDLKVGDTVEFEIENSPSVGLKAVNVSVIVSASQPNTPPLQIPNGY